MHLKKQLKYKAGFIRWTKETLLPRCPHLKLKVRCSSSKAAQAWFNSRWRWSHRSCDCSPCSTHVSHNRDIQPDPKKRPYLKGKPCQDKANALALRLRSLLTQLSKVLLYLSLHPRWIRGMLQTENHDSRLSSSEINIYSNTIVYLFI